MFNVETQEKQGGLKVGKGKPDGLGCFGKKRLGSKAGQSIGFERKNSALGRDDEIRAGIMAAAQNLMRQNGGGFKFLGSFPVEPARANLAGRAAIFHFVIKKSAVGRHNFNDRQRVMFSPRKFSKTPQVASRPSIYSSTRAFRS